MLTINTSIIIFKVLFLKFDTVGDIQNKCLILGYANISKIAASPESMIPQNNI